MACIAHKLGGTWITQCTVGRAVWGQVMHTHANIIQRSGLDLAAGDSGPDYASRDCKAAYAGYTKQKTNGCRRYAGAASRLLHLLECAIV